MPVPTGPSNTDQLLQNQQLQDFHEVFHRQPHHERSSEVWCKMLVAALVAYGVNVEDERKIDEQKREIEELKTLQGMGLYRVSSFDWLSRIVC